MRGGWTHPPSQRLPLHRLCSAQNSLSIFRPNLDISISIWIFSIPIPHLDIFHFQTLYCYFSFPDLSRIFSISRPNMDIFPSVIDLRVFLSRSSLSLIYCFFAANPRLCFGKVGRPRPIPGENELASLQATLVQNHDPPSDRLTGVKCRAISY